MAEFWNGLSGLVFLADAEVEAIVVPGVAAIAVSGALAVLVVLEVDVLEVGEVEEVFK